MTTIGEISLETTFPSDTYLMEIENPGIASYKITWETILLLTKVFSQADLATVAFSGAYSALTGLPSLSTVATSGLFTSLTDVPGSYAEQGGKYVRVNPGGTALIFDTVSSGSSGHTIQDEGSNLTARTNLNFIGTTVTVTDDAVNDRTNVTVSSGNTWTNGGTMTSGFTAVTGTLYYLNSSSSSFTITLPASGKVYLIDIIGNSPYTGLGLNNVTVTPPSGTIMGDSSLVLDRGAISVELELVGTDWRILDGASPGSLLTETQKNVLSLALMG